MHDHVMRRVWLAGWMIVTLLAAGCFQPAGAGLEATSANEALPTYTLVPTNTETPLPLPTDTPSEPPTEFVLELPSPTFEIQEIGTQVADAGNQELDPIWQTATAVYLLDQGQQPIEVQPIPQEVIPEVQQIDPLLQTATQMVFEATATAAYPMTQTAEAIFGPPTPTFPPFIPTATSGVIPPISGTDCIYEVQPTDVNLYRISLLFGVSYTSIAQASNLVNPNIIHVGDKLVIPGCGTTGYEPPPTSYPSTPYPGYTPPPNGSGQIYVVQQNDTLFALSLQWNTTVNVIASLNGIQNINLIYIGQELTIP